MRIRKRPDAKTRCLYPEDVVASIGSSPKPPSMQEDGEVSSKPAAAASEPAEEKDPELERRKYKHLGWPSSITFSFIHTKTPTQDSSTSPDNNENSNEDEVQSKSEKNKRLSKTMVIVGGSGYVEDEKYELFYDCKMRNSYIAFPSTKETLSSSDSSRQGDVTGTFLLNDEYGEESGDGEENCKTRSLYSIYESTQNLNPVYDSKKEMKCPLLGSARN